MLRTTMADALEPASSPPAARQLAYEPVPPPLAHPGPLPSFLSLQPTQTTNIGQDHLPTNPSPVTDIRFPNTQQHGPKL
jgi:hypothetical protein